MTDGSTRRRSPFAVLLLTVLGAVVPGVGLLAAGRIRSGIAVLVATVALVAGLVAYVGTSTSSLLSRALDPATLRRGAIVAIAIALVWSAVTIVSHRALRPAAAGTGERVGGSILVGVLCLGISTPLVLGANVLLTSRAVLGVVVKEQPKTAITGQDTVGGALPTASPGATHVATTGFTWSKPRLDILLIGSDAGPDRTGTRTDSMVVASIDTVTGKVLLVSIPRNLCRLRWDPASPLGQAYPNGYAVDESGCQGGDNLINAIYRDVPAAHPNLVPSDNPGADALALGIGWSLKLPIDYFMAVDLTAFKVIINSIGGVTVNIDTPIPVGGMHDQATGKIVTQYPSRWLMPGPAQHLGGADALWYARGRFASDDFDRIARQKCMINAITSQANPTAVLTSYPALAATLENNVLTDIPRKLLAPLAQLALKIKSSGSISSITVDTANIPAMSSDDRPNWSAVATAIAQSIRTTDRVRGAHATASVNASGAATATAAPTVPDASAGLLGAGGSPSSTPMVTTPTAKTSNGSRVTTDVAAGCAYSAAVAKQQTAEWTASYGSMYDAQGNHR